MGLVHENRVAAVCDFRLPFGVIDFLFGRRFFLAFRTSGMKQPAQNEGKLLERRDDDLRAVDQRCGQLFGVLIDGLDDPLGMLNLVDGILQLSIQHLSVRDHDDAVEGFRVRVVVEAGQPMRKPGNAVGYPAASRVLDKDWLRRE